MRTIDEILQQDAAARLEDAGFTHRVLAALPPRPPATRTWLRPVLVLGSATLGAILAVILSPAGFEVTQGFFDMASLRGVTPASATAAAMCVTLFACALVLAAAD
jgi:hypothetical protein